MMEFCRPEAFGIVLRDGKGGLMEKTLAEIFPLAFGPENLDT